MVGVGGMVGVIGAGGRSGSGLPTSGFLAAAPVESKTFVPALNREGTPVTTTIPIVVTFVRR